MTGVTGTTGEFGVGSGAELGLTAQSMSEETSGSVEEPAVKSKDFSRTQSANQERVEEERSKATLALQMEELIAKQTAVEFPGFARLESTETERRTTEGGPSGKDRDRGTYEKEYEAYGKGEAE